MGNSRQSQQKAPQKSWRHWTLPSWGQGARAGLLLPQERGRKGSTVTENQACYHCLCCRDRKGEDRSAVAGWGSPFTPDSNCCPGYLRSSAGHCSCEPGFPGLMHRVAMTARHLVPALPVPQHPPGVGCVGQCTFPWGAVGLHLQHICTRWQNTIRSLQKAWLMSNI